MLTRSVDLAPGRAFRWFVLSAALTLVAGAVVAVLLSRALTGRLRAAESATHRIAAGDLSTRLAPPRDGARDELSDLTCSINTMAGGLERSRGLEQQFLLSVSHDLRTPLTSIRGYAEAISRRPRRGGPAAGIILSESQRLERLVADLLDLARLDARRFRLDLVPADVGAIVAAAVEGFRPEAERSGLALDLADGGTGVRLSTPIASARWWRTCSTTGAGTRGRPGAGDGRRRRRRGRRVGRGRRSGRQADDLPHVFERLYVSRHQPPRRESGSGLGLAIVRELVAAMDGQAWAESPVTATGGTRLSVRLPRSG